MEKTQPKTFIMSGNGEIKPKKQIDWYSFFLSIASAGVVACVGFFFKIVSMMTLVQEQHAQEKIWRDDMIQRINNLEMSTRDTRDKVIGLEGRLSNK